MRSNRRSQYVGGASRDLGGKANEAAPSDPDAAAVADGGGAARDGTPGVTREEGGAGHG